MFSAGRQLRNKGALSATFTMKKQLLVLLAIGFVSLGLPAVALAGPESDPSLLKLEMKFFQHDYSKDDVAARLTRLEKMVFGETKSGDPATRLKNLVAAVPNLDASVEAPAANTAASGSRGGAGDRQMASPTPARTASGNEDEDLVSRESQITGSSQYPAVTAIEKKLLGKDYASEPIVKRLGRLETNVYGKPSQSDDLSERVDNLKARTGIDLAATPPPGTESADDDDLPPRSGGDISYVPARTTPFTSSRMPGTNLGGSQDITGSGGTYGSGSGYAGGSSGYSRAGSDGYNSSRRTASSAGTPPTAPDAVHDLGASPHAPMGLNSRVAFIENQIFSKTYPNDALPVRVARLENTVFKKSAPNMTLPARVARLQEAVGGDDSAADPAASRRVAQRPGSDASDISTDPQMPRPAPQRSGFSKIVNGLGNLVTGGGSGAYPMGNSNLVTDPRTGMLIDTNTGNIIDPRTGTVVGNTAAGIAPGTFGALPYSGFNNGLSPVGSSYGVGMGSGMRSGVGFGMGPGMRFGGMGMGAGGFPGMGLGP
jgi:hypothetical protein